MPVVQPVKIGPSLKVIASLIASHIAWLGCGMAFGATHSSSSTSISAQVSSQGKAKMAADIAAMAAADTGAAHQWGYSYSRLLQDLEMWKMSPFVQVDSIGASVKGRGLWTITVQEGDSQPRPRIFIHARTHPAEVQAAYVAIAGLNFLLDSTEEAKRLRRNFIFTFMPMYNPDGVEIGWARQNADSIDLESNWNSPHPEPEVLALRSEFTKRMKDSSRIQVALNLHSDQYNCTRFFFYHDSAGTSPFYTQLEKTFIGDVQNEFPGGIEAWHFVKSWTDSTRTQYPEGWWWKNFRDTVMALTYEDANCPNATAFEKTGRALLIGATTYIERDHVSLHWARRTWIHSSNRLRLKPSPGWIFSDGQHSINILGIHQSPNF